jgi:hypothetical protein
VNIDSGPATFARSGGGLGPAWLEPPQAVTAATVIRIDSAQESHLENGRPTDERRLARAWEDVSRGSVDGGTGDDDNGGQVG